VITGFFFLYSGFSLRKSLHFWQALAMNSPAALPNAFDALCIGGINLDRKLKAFHALHAGSSNPCVATESPGGVARNVAENLARLGLRVQLMGALGSDVAAQTVLDQLHQLGVSTLPCATLPGGSTGSYTAVLDAQGQLVMGMADMTLTELLTPDVLANAGLAQEAKLWMADMNLPAASLAWLAQRAQSHGQRLVMLAVSDPKMNRLPNDLRGIDTLVLNRGELQALGLHLGWSSDARNDANPAFTKLHAAGLQRLVVTQGEAGVVCMDSLHPAQHVKPQLTQAINVVDVSGAGDAFCAGLCASFLRYPDDALAQHAQRAMRLAVLTVQTEQTVSPAITPDLI
jgi:pseudouridine kinase